MDYLTRQWTYSTRQPPQALGSIPCQRCHIWEVIREWNRLDAEEMSKKRPTGPWAEYMKTLGSNIQRLRLERDLSQEQVAYAAGLSRYTFQKFEKGESMPGAPANPSLRNIMAIAQVLGTDLTKLLPTPWPELRAGSPSVACR